MGFLAATDEDKPGDTLRYQVLNSWWGGLFHKTDPSTTVSSFTQEMIDSKLIVFHHQSKIMINLSFILIFFFALQTEAKLNSVLILTMDYTRQKNTHFTLKPNKWS